MGTTRKLALAFAASTCLTIPFAAQSATISWTGTTSNLWTTGTNWSTGVAPIATSAVTISSLTQNPVQISSNVSLNGTTGALIVGAGTAPGTANVLNINSGFTLTMGARPVTLDGGSITGLGTLSSTGTISGYGTISSLITGTNFSANATNGTAFGGFSPFVNGTPGTPITLIGQNNLTSDSFAISNHGTFNFQGVTLTTPTLSGVSTNLNAGSLGGNNYYGALSFSGANSTVVGTVNNTNYEQFDISGTKVSLSNFSLTNAWATNAPAFFVVGTGGVLDNTGGSKLNGFMANILAGGSITNSANDANFSIAGLVTGYGTLSGPAIVTGGVSASGGTLTVDGTTGAVTAASAGWGTAGAGNTLDLKGTINFSPATVGLSQFPAAPALNPGGGTVQLDGATINTTGGSGMIQTGTGLFDFATGTNTLNGSFVANGSTGKTANYSVANGATLSLQNPTTATPAISGTNFDMAKGSKLVVGGSVAGNDGIALSGNFSFEQTDTVNAWTYKGTAGLGPDLTMTGGTSVAPTTLEVGGVNKGYTAAGFIDNFALDSLTVGKAGYVDLVDMSDNATTSGWTSGAESLYLLNLFGGTGSTSANCGTGNNTGCGILNLDGISAYLQGYGLLMDGVFENLSNDTFVDIIGAPPTATPLPDTLPLLATGLLGLGLLSWRSRQRGNQLANI